MVIAKKTSDKPVAKKAPAAKKPVAKKAVTEHVAHKAEPRVVEAQPKKVVATKKIDSNVNYYQGVGRRKRAISIVRMYTKDNHGNILVNNKDYKEYFPHILLQNIITKPLEMAGLLGQHAVSVKVNGGGKHGQAEATAHAISRMLLTVDQNLRSVLKAEQLLSRDPRIKERKKPGLKKARKAPQWSKR